MADVIGPNTYLPGQLLKVPEGMMCDDHENRPASYRVVGETDSFGSELIDWCDECYKKYLLSKENPEYNISCDHCQAVDCKTTATRDPDEGSCGPIYYLCDNCLKNLRDYHNDE